jgi:hypothetical protein
MSKNKHYLFRRQKEKQKTKQVVKNRSINMSMTKLIESRMGSMKQERLRLAESWNPYIQSVENYMQKQGKTLNDMDKMNINNI